MPPGFPGISFPNSQVWIEQCQVGSAKLKPGSESLINTISGFQIHLFGAKLPHCENAYF